MPFFDIPLQKISEETLLRKYALKDDFGELLEVDVYDILRRTAIALASSEKQNERSRWEAEFYDAMVDGAFPAGRILANAGTDSYKNNVSTINCVVSGTIYDSLDSIFDRLHESALSLKAGCGIGYEFSTLRPKGAFIKGAGAKTSGPISFADIYDRSCYTLESAGGRRGAQMLTFRVDHPDIVEMIKAKRKDGKLRQFNISVLITDEFMQSVRNKLNYKLFFPASHLDLMQEGVETIWRDWPDSGVQNDVQHYNVNELGQVECKVYDIVSAEAVWDLIMQSTYDYSDPGFILIDRVNQYNNLWFCENIRATNPCGEQPLPPYGSCLLGSINLAALVINPFGG